MVADRDFTPGWVRTELIPLLTDRARLGSMAANSENLGIRDADRLMADLVLEAVSK